MAVVHRVKRIANPRRRMKVIRNAKGRFVKAKRVVRRKKNTVRRVKRTVRRVARRRNPIRHTVRRVVRRRRANPVLIELGAINPHHFTRRKKVARKIRRRRSTARRANPRRRHAVAKRVVRRRRRRTNPVVHVRRRRRSVNAHHRRRRSSNPRRHMSRRRRNPAAFGQTGKSLLMMTGGVLLGVAATKYLPTLIPASVTGMIGTSSVSTVLFTVAGAFAAQFLAKKLSNNTAFTDAVLLGGLSLATSRALDAFAPPQLSQALALSGMGDIVPGWFAVPQNSVTNRAPAPIMVATKGVGRAFGGGFGNRR